MSPTTKKKPPRKRVPPSRRGLDLSKASAAARKTASALLQVLAGTMTPAEASAALGVSHPMYYKLEARALEGFVQGCEPKSKGAPRSVETQLKKLEQEHAKLQRECARLQALVRVVQRATGVKPPPAKSGKVGKKANGKPKRKRKPAVRALRQAHLFGHILGGQVKSGQLWTCPRLAGFGCPPRTTADNH